MRICDIQHKCKRYSSGDNRPPNEHVRLTVTCAEIFKDCEMYIKLRLWDGQVIACNLEKVNRIRGSK